jgi:hypothetical protein
MSGNRSAPRKHPLRTWLTDAQFADVEQAARAEGLTLAGFVRLVLLREAKRRARRARAAAAEASSD